MALVCLFIPPPRQFSTFVEREQKKRGLGTRLIFTLNSLATFAMFGFGRSFYGNP